MDMYPHGRAEQSSEIKALNLRAVLQKGIAFGQVLRFIAKIAYFKSRMRTFLRFTRGSIFGVGPLDQGWVNVQAKAFHVLCSVIATAELVAPLKNGIGETYRQISLIAAQVTIFPRNHTRGGIGAICLAQLFFIANFLPLSCICLIALLQQATSNTID
jgi:hypothetical protein